MHFYLTRKREREGEGVGRDGKVKERERHLLIRETKLSKAFAVLYQIIMANTNGSKN